jgi:hypothetical protein
MPRPGSSTDKGSPFAGRSMDQDGKVVIKAGGHPDYADHRGMDVFVKGVVGKHPQGST